MAPTLTFIKKIYNTKKEKKEGTQKKDWRKKRKRNNIKVEEIQQQKGRI